MKTTLLTLALMGAAVGAFAQTPSYFPREIRWEDGANSKLDGWYNLTVRSKDVTVAGQDHTVPGVPAADYGSFPGNRVWSSPILSQVYTGTDRAGLMKESNGISGGAMPAGGSMYFGGFSTSPNIFGGTLSISGNAISDLNTLLLQVAIGEAYTYDFYNGDLPTLTIFFAGDTTGTVVSVNASGILDREYLTTVSMPTGEGGAMEDQDVFSNLHLIEWDLSAYEMIESFEISFSAVEHAQLYALQLDQSSGADYTVVPEPSTYALLLAGATLGLIAIRRRNRA